MSLSETIGQHIDRAERSTERRQELFDRYMGEPRGDEQKGRSSVLTSEIFDVVESVTAEIMDLVAGEQRIASFLPTGPDDEDSAQAETDACNHLFWGENNGFQLLQTALRAGLIEQNGYVRRDMVSETVVEINEHNGMTLEQAASIEMAYAQDDTIEEIEVVELEGIEEIEVDGETIQAPTGEPISAKVRCTKTVDRYEFSPVPKGSILLSPRWHEVSLADIPFVAIEHKELQRSHYRAMGFSEETVEALFAEGDDEEKENRHNTKGNQDDLDDNDDAVLAFECYVLDDADGLPVRKRVWVGSDAKTVMQWEGGEEAIDEVDSVPICSWTPIPVPYRHNGRALAEVVEDLEAVNTVLLRQSLDNIYSTNYARPVVSSEQATKDTFKDLASPDHGAAIRVNGNAATAIAWQMPPSIVAQVMPMMQRIDGAKEERTGVTRLSQGLDENTLNKTASGQQMLISQGQKRLKLIARNFGEFVRELFLGMHADLRKGNIRSINYKAKGKWAETNPVNWPPRRSMDVAIGTGNGDNQQKQAALQVIASYQRELMAAGSSMVDEPKLFETADRMARLGGLAGAGAFFNDPEGQVYQQIQQAKARQPKQPDPAQILAEAEAEKARAQASKAEADAMLKVAEIEASEREAQRRHLEKMTELQIKMRQVEISDTKVAADINAKGEAQDFAEEQHADKMALEAAKLAQ